MKLNSRHFPTEIASVFLILTAVSVVFTWPLALNFTRAVPAGSEPAAVAYFQLFTAQWTGASLGQPGTYWNAPFFYPFHGAFAWCEPQIFTAAAMVLLAKGLGYIAAYNFIILLYMVLMGMAGYVGARLLTVDRVASLWSGIWLCAGPFSLQQICAPALLAAWSIFFLILCIFLFIIKKRHIYYWLAVTCYIVSWFTCKQLALMATLLLPVCLWPWKRFSKFVLYAALGIGLTAIIVMPFGLRQLSLTNSMGFALSLSENTGVLKPASLFMPAVNHWLAVSILKIKLYSWSIGLVMVFVILSALMLGFGRNGYLNKNRSKIVVGLLSLVVVSFIMALGPHTGVYRILFGHIPGFSFIRSPARNIVFAMFAIAVLGAPAFAFIRRKIKKGLPVICVTGFAYVLLFAEMWTMPIPLVYPGIEIEGHRQVIDWLREHDTQGPVIELPVKQGERDMEAASMLRMLYHKHPLINGYCSFTPIPYLQLKEALIDDSVGKGQEYLAAYGARYVVVHVHELIHKDYASFMKDGDVVVFEEFKHVIIKRSETLYIGKDDEIIPQKADFRSKVPFVGKIYSLRLKQVVSEPILIDFSNARKFTMMWEEGDGRRNQTYLNVRGSVILDKGADRLFWRLLSTAGNGQQAQGVLVNK
jgi:hypothetical protein